MFTKYTTSNTAITKKLNETTLLVAYFSEKSPQ